MATLLVIESAMTGLVIGRGGAKIRSIQRDTDTIIKISNGESEDTRHIKIIGSDDGQLKAADIILSITGLFLRSEKINAPSPPPRKNRPARHAPYPSEQLDLTSEQCAEIDSEYGKAERKKMESYPEIKKDFYIEHPEITALSDVEVHAFMQCKNIISVKYEKGASISRPIPKPVKTFQHAFHAFPEILNVIDKQGFSVPLPVQCQAWPIIMSGHDLISIAQTGSGKTLAYILPALVHLMRQPVERHLRMGPSVVVLGPTRELVQQIEIETKKYVYDNIHVMCVYGGVNGKEQSDVLLEVIPDIIIATPGRLDHLVSSKVVKLDHVSYLVLDQVDRMLKLGFKNQIESALQHVRPDNQTILISAAWPKSVQSFANYYVTNPLHMTVGSIDLTTVRTVQQQIIVINENQKEKWLDEYMEKQFSKDHKVIIFMRLKTSVRNLYTKFQQKNINCRFIHGGRGLLQVNRKSSLAKFRSGEISILIATDVASRGLGIEDLNLVINYDFPVKIEDYVHRVGRTGRAGKHGEAITLFSDQDKNHARALIDILKRSEQPIPLELYKMANI